MTDDLKRLTLVGFLTLVASTGCGSKAVDLGGSQTELVPSRDPAVVGTVHQRVVQLAVDEQRLYWLGDLDSSATVLQSCEKSNCAGSVVTFDQRVSAFNPFALVAGWVYWAHVESTETTRAQSGDGAGEELTLQTPTQAPPMAYGANAAYLFTNPGETGGGDLASVPLPAGGAPRTITAISPSAQILRLVATANYLYWLEQDQVPDQTNRLLRVRSDGSTQSEELASDLYLAPIQETTLGTETSGALGIAEGTGLVADERYVYWVDSALNGTIQRCPVAGCANGPEVVLSAVRTPRNLLLDGDTLYFVYELDAYQYAVAKCDPNQCALSAPLGQDLASSSAIAVDDTWLYFATTSQYVGPNIAADVTGTPHPVAQIRKVPK